MGQSSALRSAIPPCPSDSLKNRSPALVRRFRCTLDVDLCVDGLALELIANTRGPFEQLILPVDIWLGWTSNCSASCTSVGRP